MKYRLKNKVTAGDFWKLSMHHTYHSTVGVVNIVFTAAMFALAYRFWNEVGDVLQVLIFFGCILFPVLQPFVVYMRSKSQAAMLSPNLELEFDDRGLTVFLNEQSEKIPWKKIISATKDHNIIVIRSDAKHGYIISDRMLGKDKEAFWTFVQTNIERVK